MHRELASAAMQKARRAAGVMGRARRLSPADVGRGLRETERELPDPPRVA